MLASCVFACGAICVFNLIAFSAGGISLYRMKTAGLPSRWLLIYAGTASFARFYPVIGTGEPKAILSRLLGAGSKGINDGQASVILAGIQVFGKNLAASSHSSGFDDGRVPERDLKPSLC